MILGCPEGWEVGKHVGLVGFVVGCALGLIVGCPLGCIEGFIVGCEVG